MWYPSYAFDGRPRCYQFNHRIWLKPHSPVDYLAITITVIVFAFCCWVLFRSAPLIVRFLGQTGINVITRIMGLILGALGIEFIAGGLGALFPGLVIVG
ncbi:putative membrane protein [Vibrio ishigakensis]|uniref:UPF0056 membrane protein n=1 Tax=Vibrio ishigakensis TaxID=1481914 RepID=A0A0B8QKQ7_9VIBR|nr:putative membrane protein [Vibrio ishigakensis]